MPADVAQVARLLAAAAPSDLAAARRILATVDEITDAAATAARSTR